MFARGRPESVGLCVIMWMDVDTLKGKIASFHRVPGDVG